MRHFPLDWLPLRERLRLEVLRLLPTAGGGLAGEGEGRVKTRTLEKQGCGTRAETERKERADPSWELGMTFESLGLAKEGVEVG